MQTPSGKRHLLVRDEAGNFFCRTGLQTPSGKLRMNVSDGVANPVRQAQNKCFGRGCKPRPASSE
ncbi:MAG: hypothetical protein DRI57_23735 [Deltaproteobacteria bacterium]|nr:MAG: hypothetical protein DRI57_23735 [Deltaproteobacteria bacterium]